MLVAALVVTKTLAATAVEVVIDNNQPKLAAEEMTVELATAMVTKTTMARGNVGSDGNSIDGGVPSRQTTIS
jgi:hypothetical protein